MINQKIVQLIKSLGIECYYQKVSIRKDKYVIFSVYQEKDTDVVDNKSISTTYYITINYWYTNPNDARLYKDIKRILKENKFKFQDCRDVVDIDARTNNLGNEYFGKNLDFVFREFNLETL